MMRYGYIDTNTSGGISANAVTSGIVASGSVFGFFGPVRDIASGTVGSFDIASGGILSGAVSSGSLTSYQAASGNAFPIANETYLFVSGGIWTALSSETISGGRCVALDPASGLAATVRIAMAALSGRMPAVGYVPSNQNVLSGIQVNVHVVGMVAQTSGMGDFSGCVGRRVWVSNSGQLCVLSGSWWSGGALSGSIGQLMGVVATNLSGMTAASIALNTDPSTVSGGPLGYVQGFLLP